MNHYELTYPEEGGLTPPLQDGHEIHMGRPYWDASWPFPLSAVEDFFKSLWNFIIDIPLSIYRFTIGAVKNLWDSIAGAFTGIWTAIAEAFKSIWSGIWSGLTSLWTAIAGAFTQVTGWLGELFTTLYDWITRGLLGLWRAVSGAFQVMAQGISAAVSWLAETFLNLLQQLWEAVSRAFSALGRGISNALSSLWQAISAGLLALGEGLGEGLSAMSLWLDEAVVKPLDALPGNLLGGVFDTASDFFARIAEWLMQLFKPLANFFVKDVLGGLLKVFEPFAEFFSETMETFFATLTGQVSHGGTMTPESAYNVVPSMISLLGITLLGFTGMTVAGELLHPLKSMGLGHVSAALYDVTNYKLISGAFVGALTYAMIRQPLGYYFNQWFHPSIPDERMVRELMSRKAFTRPEDLRNPALSQSVRSFSGVAPSALEQLFLGYHGYHAGYFGMFKEMANTPLRYFPLAGIARTGFYDYTWFQEALARSGYSETAVVQLHGMYQAMVLDEARGRHSSTVVRRYKEGLTDESGFDQEMRSLLYSEDQVGSERVYAQLEYQTDFAMDLMDGFRFAFRKRKITEAQFRRGLAGIGMVEERIDGWVFREGVKRKEEDKAEDLPDATGKHAAAVVKRYKEGLIDDERFGQELTTLEYSPEEIEENRAFARIEYETDYAMDILDALRYAYRKGKITEDQFRAELKRIGMVEERIEGWVIREGVRRKGEG